MENQETRNEKQLVECRSGAELEWRASSALCEERSGRLFAAKGRAVGARDTISKGMMIFDAIMGPGVAREGFQGDDPLMIRMEWGVAGDHPPQLQAVHHDAARMVPCKGIPGYARVSTDCAHKCREGTRASVSSGRKSRELEIGWSTSKSGKPEVSLCQG